MTRPTNSRPRRRSGPHDASERAKTLRCAIYTRVSTDSGLEQDFNSLDAQREACAAYIRSQAHEGWVLAPGHFDDGGYSGGTLDRPGLTKLLAAVERRQIDVIVVYKVDRLTRSLADFAKLVEAFDARGVSFISITQSFNTTTSMGRLTLNMLLSFAQFEREVTGERIRDKIAASKKKGIWVGGVVPLGYRVVERKLLVVEDEAKIVHLIFDRYLALGSIGALLVDLRERGIVTRRRTLSTGQTIGGIPFMKGPLSYLLRNRMYVGELNHGSNSYPAEHSALISKEIFDAAQVLLSSQAVASGYSQSKSEALLQGKIYDDRGHRMTPSFAVKGGVRYRYYISRATIEGRSAEAGTIARVPAADVEKVVLEAIANMGATYDSKFHGGDSRFATIAPDISSNNSNFRGTIRGSDRPKPNDGFGPRVSAKGPAASAISDQRAIYESVERITVRANTIEIVLTPAAAERAGESALVAAWTKPPFRVHRDILAPAEGERADPRAMSFDTRSRILKAIGKARRWFDDLASGRTPDLDALAAREGRSVRSVTVLLSLAFLEPGLVTAIVENRMPRGIGLTRLTELPSGWDEQRRALGLI